MPPSRDLYWSEEGLQDLENFLSRRKDKQAVITCIEDALLGVAGEPSIAIRVPGPREFLIYRFNCSDKKVALFIQAELLEMPDGSLVVLACNTIKF
jgi:hypothetical protein